MLDMLNKCLLRLASCEYVHRHDTRRLYTRIPSGHSNIVTMFFDKDGKLVEERCDAVHSTSVFKLFLIKMIRGGPQLLRSSTLEKEEI